MSDKPTAPTLTVSTKSTPKHSTNVYANQFNRVLQDVANVANHRLIPVNTNINNTAPIPPTNNKSNEINHSTDTDINPLDLSDTDISVLAHTQRTHANTLFQQLSKIRQTRIDLFNTQLHSWPTDVNNDNMDASVSADDSHSDNDTDTEPTGQSTQYQRVWDEFRRKDQHISTVMASLNTLSAQHFKLQQIIDSHSNNT